MGCGCRAANYSHGLKYMNMFSLLFPVSLMLSHHRVYYRKQNKMYLNYFETKIPEALLSRKLRSKNNFKLNNNRASYLLRVYYQ